MAFGVPRVNADSSEYRPGAELGKGEKSSNWQLVLSYPCGDRLGGDSAIVGRGIRLNNEPSVSAKKTCETLET
jgi:hypothetical protein